MEYKSINANDTNNSNIQLHEINSQIEMQSLNTILFISKKVCYRKQIARQQSCSTALKRFLTSSFITVQRLVVVSLTVCAHVGGRKILVDDVATPPREGGG